MSAALLPCPFCGHRPLSTSWNAALWWISCTHCEAEVSFGTKEGAEAQWNARHNPVEPRPERLTDSIEQRLYCRGWNDALRAGGVPL